MFVFVSLDNFYFGPDDAGSMSVVTRNRDVLDASDPARNHGVLPGIPVQLARRRCPDLEIKEFRAEDYAERFDATWSVIAEFTPMVETTDLHQGFLDLSKDVKRFGCADALIFEISNRLSLQTGIRLKWGGGADKWMAWLARAHNQFITPAMESLVLSKLSIESMSLPHRITERMHHFDIHTVAQVINLPAGFLESHLGFDHEFVLRFLTRHKDSVHPNFPLRKIASQTHVEEYDESALSRAICDVSRDITTQLNEAFLQASELRIDYVTRAKCYHIVHKLSQGALSIKRLERILTDLMPEQIHSHIKRLCVEAIGLIPSRTHQDTLWGERYCDDNREQLERATNKLNTRYDSDSIVSGSVAFRRQQPRFAQLIYQSRGLALP
jgi:nucleotidyltransferase/DNA polymerase involved in DNA repair